MGSLKEKLSDIELHVLKFPCVECGKPATIAQKIKPDGKIKFFNLMPLCEKHSKDFIEGRGIEKLRNTYNYLKRCGWTLTNNIWGHKDE